MRIHPCLLCLHPWPYPTAEPRAFRKLISSHDASYLKVGPAALCLSILSIRASALWTLLEPATIRVHASAGPRNL